MNGYFREYPLLGRAISDFGLFADPERALRLGPQWDVKSFVRQDDDFTLEAEYDRSEQVVRFAGRIEEQAPDGVLRLSLTSETLRLQIAIRLLDGPGGGRLSLAVDGAPDPAPEDLLEYDLWARSLLDYLRVSGSRSPAARLWKWCLDRWWLKLPQSGKRILLFILAGEALSFVFLVAILLWWRYVQAP